jgi:hypothetical protein
MAGAGPHFKASHNRHFTEGSECAICEACSTQSDEATMEFSPKDAEDLARVKAVMLKKAEDGDAVAAQAYASLLNAETERSKAVAAAAQEKQTATVPNIPAPKVDEISIAGRVAAGLSPTPDAVLVNETSDGMKTWQEKTGGRPIFTLPADIGDGRRAD